MNRSIVCPYCASPVVLTPDSTCPACSQPVVLPQGHDGRDDDDLADPPPSEPVVTLPSEVAELAEAEAAFSEQRDQALADLEEGRAVDPRVLDVVTRDILPRCRRAAAELARDQHGGSLPERIRDFLTQYHLARQQAWLAFERAIRDNDRRQALHHERLLAYSRYLLSQSQLPGIRPASAEEHVVGFHAALLSLTPRTWVVPTLTYLNLGIFVLMVLAGGQLFQVPVDLAVRWGANFGPRTLGGEWWRVVTCIFLHFGVIHVAFNMWVLWQLGKLVERLVGNVGFLVLYLASGVFASMASLAWNPTVVSAGASGAVFGVCGALLGFLTLRRDTIPVHVLKSLRGSLVAFVAYNVVFGLAIPAIDMAAHLGGLVGGFACGLVLSQPLRADMAARRWRRDLLTAAGAAILLPLVFAALPKAPPDVDATVDRILALEGQAFARYDKLSENLSGGTIDRGEFADAVERDVLGRYLQAQQLLAPLLESSVRHKNQITKLDNYLQLRVECWRLLMEAAREDDAEKMRLFHEKTQEANEFAGSTSS